MSRILMSPLLCGALLMMMAVMLGAFAAHGLKNQLSPAMLATFQTGVQYQSYHALGLLLIGALQRHDDASRTLRLASGLLLLGIVLFSGSLYGLALSGVRSLGLLTPFGGLSFIVGWACLARWAWQQGKAGVPPRNG